MVTELHDSGGRPWNHEKCLYPLLSFKFSAVMNTFCVDDMGTFLWNDLVQGKDMFFKVTMPKIKVWAFWKYKVMWQKGSSILLICIYCMCITHCHHLPLQMNSSFMQCNYSVQRHRTPKLHTKPSRWWTISDRDYFLSFPKIHKMKSKRSHYLTARSRWAACMYSEAV